MGEGVLRTILDALEKLREAETSRRTQPRRTEKRGNGQRSRYHLRSLYLHRPGRHCRGVEGEWRPPQVKIGENSSRQPTTFVHLLVDNRGGEEGLASTEEQDRRWRLAGVGWGRGGEKWIRVTMKSNATEKFSLQKFSTPQYRSSFGQLGEEENRLQTKERIARALANETHFFVKRKCCETHFTAPTIREKNNS